MENQAIERTWKALTGYCQYHGYHALCDRMGWEQSADRQMVAMEILRRYFEPYREMYAVMLKHWDGTGDWVRAYRRAYQTY